jgi:putative endopeptidase
MAAPRAVHRRPRGRTRPSARPSVSRRGQRGLPDPRFSVAHMDRTVRPSVDFYRYATGRWVRRNPVPSDKSRWGAFDELLQRNFETVRRILVGARRHAHDPDPTPVRQVGALFASALDLARRKRAKLAPLRPELDRINAIASVPDLYTVLAEFHREGLGGGFAGYAYPDKRSSGVYAFYLHQGGLSLPDREYYLDPQFEEVRGAYRRHLERSFRRLGDDPGRAEEAAGAVVALETELARASRTRTELRDEERNYHRFAVGELASRHASVPWERYLVDREIGGAPHVIVEQPEFFDAFALAVSAHDLREWRDYLRWHLLAGSAPFLDAETEAEHFDFFFRTLRGQKEPEPAWKRAAHVVDEALGEALGQLYVERAFPPEARARMGVLVGDLCAVFRDRLRSLPWMSQATRDRALAKFARFEPKIGHPEKFRDYSSIRIDPTDYFGNVRRAAAFEVHRQMIRVGQPVDRTEWGMTPPTVNAYITFVKNEIVFPAGILQPPFFDVTADDAVNYGGIGAVIGHEITHGFDDQGRKFDEAGNLNDWWTEADAREFERRAKAVVEQYNRFEPLPGHAVNGELTLGENLADLGGLSVAFEALQRRLAADPSQRRKIEGLTLEQRFFVAWAQIWRQNSLDAELLRRLITDPHSPGKYRALGAATNLDAFFDAFGIREGSPMWRPKSERTSVW